MNARSPEHKLADAVARLVEENDWVTFAQLARFLEEREIPWRGELNLSLNSDSNVLLWSGMSAAMCDAVLRLLHERRIYFHRSSVAAYHVHGGVLSLPLADSPRQGGLEQPHWLPVALRAVPPPFALH